MYALMAAIFVIGYLSIALEHPLKIDKAAAAILTAVVCWTILVLGADSLLPLLEAGAHGSGAKIGVPIVQFEIATGRRKVLAFLGDTMTKEFKYTIGGTYNLQLNPSGDRLFITFNGAPAGGRRTETFGKPCVCVVDIPPRERS